MQVLSKPDVAGLLDRSMADVVPGGGGLAAWQALLRSHATLMRQLERDLGKETGLALAGFDVLAQLAIAGGALRMTELADRALMRTSTPNLLSSTRTDSSHRLQPCASEKNGKPVCRTGHPRRTEGSRSQSARACRRR